MTPAIGHENQHLYEFGAFRLDAGERALTRDGARISLPPKALDTLLLLVQNSGHALTKDHLLKALWPDSFVEENNLTQQISQLRRALGENGDGPTYIETVPKLGYRFVCEVRQVDAGASAFGPCEPEVLISKRTRTHIVLREEIEEEEGETEIIAVPAAPSTVTSARRRPLLIAVTLLSLGFVGAAIYRFRPPSKPPLLAVAPRSLAVLPLRNLKPSPETDFLGMALADAIANRLGYARELNITPLSSVAKYRNTEADARQIARELHVQNVLAGSYVKEGDDLRITMEFVAADGSTSPWRDNLDLKYEKLLTVQDRVAIDVIHAMGLQLQPEQADRLKRGAPTNPVAYEYYLRGLDQGFQSNFGDAVKLLEKSVALEPGNAMAWTELATACLGYGANQGGNASYADEGWRAFHRAIELDPQNRFIVDLMAFQLLEHNKAEEAVALLKESLRHNPTDSFAHWYLSEAYRYGGALEQSLAEGELALKLNPNVSENLTFNTYLYAGQYQKFLDTLPSGDNNARAIFYRGLAHYSLGDKGDAQALFDRAYALNPALVHAQIGRALSCALRHQNAEGLDLMRTVERSGSDDGEMLYKMAQAYAQLGAKPSALRLLRRTVDLNFYPYAYFVSDPLLDPIRSEPEYPAVMELARQHQEAFLHQLL